MKGIRKVEEAFFASISIIKVLVTYSEYLCKTTLIAKEIACLSKRQSTSTLYGCSG